MGAKDRPAPEEFYDTIAYFTDSLTGNIVWVLDLSGGNPGFLDTGDYYLYPTSDSFKPFYTTWKLGTNIDPGDVNVNPINPAPLNQIAVASIIDDDNDGNLYELNEHVVPEQDWTNEYPIEDADIVLEMFNDGQVSTIYGDFRGIDIPVLPGTLPIEVHWYDATGSEVTTLKVEQTYTVTVKVNCTLPDYAKIVAEVRVAGNGSTQDVIAVALFNPGVTEYTFHNVTPWRGTRGWDNVRYSVRGVEVRVYADFYKQLDAGPYDGFYGYDEVTRFLNDYWVVHYVRYPGGNVDGQYTMSNVYDCFNRVRPHVDPEGLIVKANRECISKLDQVYPNLMLSISNVDNPIDANDPSGPIMSDPSLQEPPLFAWVNASGGGIKGLAIGVSVTETGGITKYILQINENGTVTSWRWTDTDNDYIYDPGEDLDLVSDPNFPSLPIYKWMDINGNGAIDTSEWLDYDLDQTMDLLNELHDLNNDGAVNTLEWLDINEDFQIDLPWEWQSRNKNTDVNTNGVIDSGEWVDVNNNGVFDVGVDIWIYDAPLPSTIRYYNVPYAGMIDAVVLPSQSGCGDVTITVFTNRVLYNFVGGVPGVYYRLDTFGLFAYPKDYEGKTKVTNEKIYDDINFAQLSFIDMGLYGSEFRNPYPPYGVTTEGPFAQYPANLININMELRSYPGGQTALPGWGWGLNYTGTPDMGPIDAQNVVGLLFGWNSRHAQFREIFWKLGTEFYPLTDYVFGFYVKDKFGNHLSFDDGTISKIIIHGEKADPNAQPVFVWRPWYAYYDGWRSARYLVENAIEPENVTFTPTMDGPYNYMGYHDTFDAYYGLPVEYFVGDIVVTENGVTVGGIPVNYWPEFEDGWQEFRGIIPTGPGIIHITVVDGEGNSREYKYCTSCMDTPEGVPVHAIELTGFPSSLTVDSDNVLQITAKVYPFDAQTAPWGENTITTGQPLANNVLMFVWQDIGILNPLDGKRYGVGDGWLNGQQPKFGGSPIDTLSVPASTFNAGPVYNGKDWNGDGKISFTDRETEIVGTYDKATGTWKGGFIALTSFTNNINQGVYTLPLTSVNGAQLNEIGFDFDGNNVILTDEDIPVRITAYSYGDDGVNPRTATKTAGNGFEPWEVYLAGEVMLPVVGTKDLNVSTEPCLTAGVLPEAQPDGKPLTFIVTDADGNPVDLSVGLGGGEVNDVMIWNGLFDDVVPWPELPVYYWTRTDLHNTEEVVDPTTGISHILNAWAANDMYATSFDWNHDGLLEKDANGNLLEPIKPDFSEKEDGVYKFSGFVANDKGEFTVKVYSPDRKHYGEVVVKVELPKISYEIVNIEDPNGTVHTVPGDPDFVMTVGDIRVYKVTVTAKDCEGKPIGGPKAEECRPVSGLYAGFLPWMAYTPHYFNWLGYDIDGDGSIYGFRNTAGRWVYEWTPFMYYGNTRVSSLIYKDLHYGKLGVPTIPPKDMLIDDYAGGYTYGTWDYRRAGWMTAIYNSNYNKDQWNWGTLYPDFNEDCIIDINDTLPLNEEGKVTFYIETDDISVLGGVLGKNPYVGFPLVDHGYPLGDVAGWSAYLGFPRGRFGSLAGTGNGVDLSFYLDWYGNTDKYVNANFMKFKILNGETHQELTKDIFNPDFFDLTYGLENHIVVQALPADERDLAVREEGNGFWGVQVQLVGNVETWAYGTMKHNDQGVAETTLMFRPRGTGGRVAYLAVVSAFDHDFFWDHESGMVPLVYPWWYDFTSPGEPLYWTYDDRGPDFTLDYTCEFLASPYGHDIEDQRELQRINPPTGKSSWPLPYFDAGKGLALTLKGELVVGVETEVTVKVTEAGPNFPVAGAEVTLYGAGVDLSGVTDADGVAKFMVKPTEAGEILVSASKDGYVPGKVVVVVGADTIAPELTVDKPVSPTNKPTVTITGIATDNAGVPMVLVNGVEATVGADGKFSAEVTLKEGENEIVVVAKDKSGNKTEKTLKVVLDTVPPEVTVIPPAGPITTTKVKLTGYVEAGAKVTVNDKPATVATDDWEVELTLEYGENKVTVVATDAVGNTKKVETTVVVFKKTTLELQIGNPTPKVNGAYGDPLEAAPFIKDGRTMVPLRFIAEAFGANVEWIPETKGINITLELKSAVHTIGLQVGNPTAIVDGQVVTLDVAPVIVNGRTFVPIRFIAESFGAKVDWNSLYQTVIIEFLWY